MSPSRTYYTSVPVESLPLPILFTPVATVASPALDPSTLHSFTPCQYHPYSSQSHPSPTNSCIAHQQKTTLLAGVLTSTYQTCSLLQGICKEKFCKFHKLGQFLTTCLAIKLAMFTPGLQSSLPKTHTWFAINVISHLQVAARHASFSHFFILFTKNIDCFQKCCSTTKYIYTVSTTVQ